MTHANLRPEKLTFGQEKPDIQLLPADVAARIEDMWRVGGMLSRFVEHSHAAKKRRELIGDACALGMRAVMSIPFEGEAPKDLDQGFESIRTRSSALNRDKPESEAWVSNWVGVTYDQGHRLSCEAELLFFHSALDYLPKADKEDVEELPLIHCLRRLRNVVTHFRATEVREADFQAKAVARTDPNKVLVNFVFTGSWFLVVDPRYLLATRGGAPHADLFAWFKRICDTHPFWCVLQAAVHQLCDFYRQQG
jgi:hypothetical protein